MSDPSKRIGVVVPSLINGGAERVAETLAREFARTAEVTIITMDPRISPRQLRATNPLPWTDRIPPGCRHVHLPSTRSGLWRLAPLVIRFAKLARQKRFDSVYSFLTWTNVLVALANLPSRNYRHIASEHSMVDSLYSDGRQLARMVKYLPLVYRLPDWVVVVSDAARNSLLRAGLLPRPERAVTIPNPVDTLEIQRLAKVMPETTPFPSALSVVACVARLHPQKDHVTLLKAMRVLPPSVGLALIGDGPLRTELEQTVIEFRLTDRVHFSGALTNPYPMMQRADVVVLPSKEEGFGLVAVEAAILNVPFVGSDVGGLKEVCDFLGHPTFPTGDHVALASAIMQALSGEPSDSGAHEENLATFGAATVAQTYLELGCGAPSQPQSRRKALRESDHGSFRQLLAYAERAVGAAFRAVESPVRRVNESMPQDKAEQTSSPRVNTSHASVEQRGEDPRHV